MLDRWHGDSGRHARQRWSLLASSQVSQALHTVVTGTGEIAHWHVAALASRRTHQGKRRVCYLITITTITIIITINNIPTATATTTAATTLTITNTTTTTTGMMMMMPMTMMLMMMMIMMIMMTMMRVDRQVKA